MQLEEKTPIARGEEEEEEEEVEGLYLRIETRKRVQTNEAKSKRRRASPTKTTGRLDNTPASRCLPSRRVLLARKGYRQPITPQGYRGGGRIPKSGLARATNPNSGVSGPGTPVGVGWNTHGTPKDVPPDRPKKSRVSNPTP